MTVRRARLDPGRGRRPDPDRHASTGPTSSTPPTASCTRAGRPLPPARRRPRRPGRRAHRRRPGLLRRRRLRLHRRAHQGRRACAARRWSHGRQIVTGMVACRVPVVAAVNGPAVGLGLQPRRPVRHRLHGRERPPGRPPRAHRPRGRRRRARSPGRCSPASSWPRSTPSPATGSRPSGRPRSASSTTCARTTRCSTRPWPAPDASPSCPRRRPRTPSASSTCTSSGPCWPPSTSRSRPRTAPSPRPSCGPTSTACMAKDSVEGRPDMDFELTDEQIELQRIAREVAEREIPSSLVRSVVEDDADTDALWKTLVALEWPGLTVPADARRQRRHRRRAGRACSRSWAGRPTPRPLLATTTQHLPLRARRPAGARSATVASRPSPAGAPARRSSTPTPSPPGATATAGCSTARPPTCSTPTGPTSSPWWPTADGGLGVFLIPAEPSTITREPSIDASLHLGHRAPRRRGRAGRPRRHRARGRRRRWPGPGTRRSPAWPR